MLFEANGIATLADTVDENINTAIDKNNGEKALDDVLTEGDWKYRVLTDGIEIAGYTGSANAITIPDTIDGQNVTSIGNLAFRGCSSLEEITIPVGIVKIGTYVFTECSNLNVIEVASENPAYKTFDGCLYDKDLTEIICCPANKSAINFAENVEKIGSAAFYECKNLKKINLPDSVKNIGIEAFRKCSDLSSIKLPVRLVSIGYCAFGECSSLEGIELPKNVGRLDYGVFYDCVNLKSVKALSSLMEIGDSVFEKCDQLTLFGYKGSSVQKYADEHGIQFKEIVDDTPIFTFTLEDVGSGVEGTTIALSGTLTLDDSVEATEENLSKAANAIFFESSDESKAKTLTCEAIQNDDKKSALLKVWLTLYNEGTAMITAEAAYSPTVKCEIAISADTSGKDSRYECDYTEEVRELFMNQGMTNTVKYFCQDGNFPASIFVSENDTTFGSKLTMFLTDSIYRGWDGWRDLIDGSTSVEQAEKILASVLDDYQKKLKGLSEAKTAQKYAKMINDAFLDYTKSTNLFKALNSEEITTARKYFDENNIAKLLYEGKYDDITAPVNQILQQGTETTEAWNDLMEGFTQSGELSTKIKKGWKNKIGNFEIGGGLDDIGKVLGKISFAQDTVNYLYQLESLLTADEMYCEMLIYVKNNCVYSVVQEAAANLYSVINNGVAGIISDISLKAANLAGNKILDFVLDKAIEGCLPLTIIKAGFDWGVTISNVLFKTGTIQELKDSLRSQAYFANCLALWTLENGKKYIGSIGTDEEIVNGKKFYYSLYMVWKARINAEETLQSLLKTEGIEWCKNYSTSVKVKDCLESYKDHIFTDEKMQNMLGIAVACPVNLEVYDESGTKLLTLLDGIESQGFENGIYYYCSFNTLSEDYEKYIYYNEENNYSIKLEGTDLGLVDCAVSSIDDDGRAVEYYFNNEKIDNNTVMIIDNISKDSVEYKVEKKDGAETSLKMEKRSSDVIVATAISLDISAFEMEINDRYLLTVSFQPVNATNQNVVWKSSNSDIVSVNNDGLITAKDLGTATISVSQGNLIQTCEITVKEKKSIDSIIRVQSVSISLSATVKKGNTIQLNAKVLPENATNKTLSWTSDNPSVAVVSSEGLVTAVSAGKATITASSTDGSNVSASCVITVTKPNNVILPDDNNNSGDNTGGNDSNNENSGEDNSTGDNTSGGGTTDSNTFGGGSSGGSTGGGTTGGNASGGSSSGGNASGSGADNNNGNTSEDNNKQDESIQIKLLYYIIEFNANAGAKLSRKTMTLLNDDNLGILPKVQRENFIFNGWYTQKSGGIKVDSSTILNAGTTLFAQWTKIDKPSKVKALSLKSKQVRQLAVSCQKIAGAKGYEIACSTNKKFPSSSTKKTISDSPRITLKKLKSGKKYYVRVRAYKEDSTGKKIYGAYTKAKSIKVK